MKHDIDLVKALRGELNTCGCRVYGRSECGCDTVWPEDVTKEAAATEQSQARIAELEAENARLTKQCNSYKLLTKAQEGTNTSLRNNLNKQHEATGTLDSEREANAQLTAAIAQQAERIGMLEIALDTRTAHLSQCESALSERDATVMQQATRLAAAEKDAQRYQFIREDHEDGNECAWFAPLLYEEELDDAIDAAIAALKEKK